MSEILSYRGSLDFQGKFNLFANTEDGLEKIPLDTVARGVIGDMLADIRLTDVNSIMAHSVLSHYHGGLDENGYNMAADVYYSAFAEGMAEYMVKLKPGERWEFSVEVLEKWIKEITRISNEEQFPHIYKKRGENA
jgi:hypothetical protein